MVVLTQTPQPFFFSRWPVVAQSNFSASSPPAASSQEPASSVCLVVDTSPNCEAYIEQLKLHHESSNQNTSNQEDTTCHVVLCQKSSPRRFFNQIYISHRSYNYKQKKKLSTIATKIKKILNFGNNLVKDSKYTFLKFQVTNYTLQGFIKEIRLESKQTLFGDFRCPGEVDRLQACLYVR